MWHWCHSSPAWNTAFGLTKTAVRVTMWQPYPTKLSSFPKAQKCWNIRHLGILAPVNIRLRNTIFQGHRWSCHLLKLFCFLQWNNVHIKNKYVYLIWKVDLLYSVIQENSALEKINRQLHYQILVKIYASEIFLFVMLENIFLLILCKGTFLYRSSGSQSSIKTSFRQFIELCMTATFLKTKYKLLHYHLEQNIQDDQESFCRAIQLSNTAIKDTALLIYWKSSIFLLEKMGEKAK